MTAPPTPKYGKEEADKLDCSLTGLREALDLYADLRKHKEWNSTEVQEVYEFFDPVIKAAQSNGPPNATGQPL